jgi:hypothetical protein
MAPGRAHNFRRDGSPGAMVISVCPGTQPVAEGEDEGAGADGLGPVDLTALVEVRAVGTGEAGGAELFVGALFVGSVERFSDGPPADLLPGDVLQPTMATTPATIHPAAHHRIPIPPGSLVPTPKVPCCQGERSGLARSHCWPGQSPTPARQDCTALVVGNAVPLRRCAVARACAPPCVVRSQFSAAGLQLADLPVLMRRRIACGWVWRRVRLRRRHRIRRLTALRIRVAALAGSVPPRHNGVVCGRCHRGGVPAHLRTQPGISAHGQNAAIPIGNVDMHHTSFANGSGGAHALTVVPERVRADPCYHARESYVAHVRK